MSYYGTVRTSGVFVPLTEKYILMTYFRRDMSLSTQSKPSHPENKGTLNQRLLQRESSSKAFTISKMKADLRGRVILPEDQDYSEARKVYNGMIDKHPKLIVRCVNVADVRLAIEFARENDLVVAVRGGGHNGAGLATCDDGMVIDLSPMKGVRFDPCLSTIRAEPGCTQGDVNHLGRSFGFAVPAGVVSTTGIAGLTLGGGTGYLTRKYGLTIDNLLEVDIVLADGSFVTANAEDHPDLFWAVRGGGCGTRSGRNGRQRRRCALGRGQVRSRSNWCCRTRRRDRRSARCR